MLDTALLSAAQEAGAQARFGVDVTELCRDRTGRVTGVLARVRGGDAVTFRAPLTIGADGLRSTVARLAGAPTVRRGSRGERARVRLLAESVGLALRLVLPARGERGDHPDQRRPGLRLGRAARRTLRRRARPQRPGGPVRARAGRGRTCRLRRSSPAQNGSERCAAFPACPGTCAGPPGPGWALVGDAGYFKDPLTAHGITDALRDAEFLARAVVDGGRDALAEYERTRDRLSLPLLDVAESIAAYRWDLGEIRELLLAESAAMKPEVAALRALDTPALAEAADLDVGSARAHASAGRCHRAGIAASGIPPVVHTQLGEYRRPRGGSPSSPTARGVARSRRRSVPHGPAPARRVGAR